MQTPLATVTGGKRAPKMTCLNGTCDGTDVELVLVGDGPSRGAFEARLQNPALENKVRLLGWGDAARVREEMLAARALVVPSLAEGLPVVIMEAFALCRPVVATTVGAVPELVADGQTGWLVAPGSPVALAAAIDRVLAASPDELFALGKNGAQRIKERHTVVQQARVLAGLLNDTELTQSPDG